MLLLFLDLLIKLDKDLLIGVINLTIRLIQLESLLDVCHSPFILLQFISAEGSLVECLDIFGVDGDCFREVDCCSSPVSKIKIAAADIAEQDPTDLCQFVAFGLSGSVKLVGVQNV
jgi:hypothetical protein